MYRLIPAAVVAVVTINAASFAQSASNQLTDIEKAAGWKLLFDGQSTDYWRGFQMREFPSNNWTVEDGCLKCTGDGEPSVDLITINQYGDFEFTCEWRVAPKGNSGIIYRVTEKHPATWQTGPEFQVLDDLGHGKEKTDWQSAGALYELQQPSAEKILKPAGEFNHARIRVKDNRIEHWLNGVKIIDQKIDGDDWKQRISKSKFAAYDGFGLQPRGHIALQDHGDEVWYRNIKVRDLSEKMPGEISLFDGQSLKGWTHHLEPDGPMENTWTVEDGIINCKGQPAGYIRTEENYKNFILKLEWRFNPVTKEAGNSGVLLRMIGPDKVWPKSVEAQLHSSNAGDFWNIDDYVMKTDPARTRGRNTKKTKMAEYPIGEWNEYEIIVNRGDVILIVNGEEVNRAWDVEENAGKICLQSEGAEIHFRNIRLAPIP